MREVAWRESIVEEQEREQCEIEKIPGYIPLFWYGASKKLS
jgi:hypothetical protein